jgi:hypothetical protein
MGAATQFYERPWLAGTIRTVLLPIAQVKYQLRGSHGTTVFDISGDQIRIRLTDNGEILMDTRQSGITFRTKFGKTFTF